MLSRACNNGLDYGRSRSRGLGCLLSILLGQKSSPAPARSADEKCAFPVVLFGQVVRAKRTHVNRKRNLVTLVSVGTRLVARTMVENGFMVTLDRLRVEKKQAILELGERYGARNIRVFGSVARGDNREASDIDFLVDLDNGRTIFDLAGFVADLKDLLGVDVDVVTPGGLRYLRDRVLTEALPL
jgi:predicted nucleotidyltransferase